MKKIIVSIVFLGLSGLYVVYGPKSSPSRDTSSVIVPAPTANTNTTPTYTVRRGDDEEEGGIRITPVQTPTPTPTPAPAPAPAVTPPKTGYKDGVYTGSIADAFYGLVQVKATIAGGKITDVVFLSYPNDRSTSVEINTQAMPLLKQEAIAAQSATVNTVSGATETSRAFRESLGVALASAKL